MIKLMFDAYENQIETHKSKGVYIPDVFDILMSRRENSLVPFSQFRKSSYETKEKTPHTRSK